MPEYRVTWTIDLTADSPLDAAQQALIIQRDPDSWATFFVIFDVEDHKWNVDLDDMDDPSVVQLR